MAGGGLLFSASLSADLPKEKPTELVAEGAGAAANENGTPLEADGGDVAGDGNKGAAADSWGAAFTGSLSFLLPSQKGFS
jgi:hypothetical protein